MNKNLVCIVCPRGCSLNICEKRDGITVSGNACKRGLDYAINECTNPTRSIASTVRVKNSNQMLSVKTEKPIPKDKIFEVMLKIRKAQVLAPIKIGDIIIKDICGTNIVATKNIAQFT